MDFPDPGIEPGSPALQADSLPSELSGKPYSNDTIHFKIHKIHHYNIASVLCFDFLAQRHVDSWVSLIAQLVKNLPAMQETLVQFLGQKDLLEKG